tara:strand:- start:1429 stop:2034 length:606 start_codon:yes stop_codon:yes gene_type:complete
MTKVCVLDYGSGNVASVYNLIKFLNYECVISNEPKTIETSTHLILPGVGAFGASMEKIKKKIPIEILENQVLKKKKPFLGICVGMQVMTEIGEEFGRHQGLGWIKGKVVKIKSKILPHIGWNDIVIKKTSKIFDGLAEHRDFYFVNSFHCNINDKNLVIAETEYEEIFCSAFQKENIIGVQFHPEKSQKAGQILIKNFLSL